MTEFLYAASIPSAVTYEEMSFLCARAIGKTVLELGAWHGRSTVALASVATRVHSVDWHRGDEHAGEGDTLDSFLKNIAYHGFRDKITIHLGRFEDVLPVLGDHRFGLVFLDGHHSTESVRQDIALFGHLIKPGGWAMFHDYGLKEVGDRTFGVTEAVNEWAIKLGVKIQGVRTLVGIKLPKEGT